MVLASLKGRHERSASKATKSARPADKRPTMSHKQAMAGGTSTEDDVFEAVDDDEALKPECEDSLWEPMMTEEDERLAGEAERMEKKMTSDEFSRLTGKAEAGRSKGRE